MTPVDVRTPKLISRLAKTIMSKEGYLCSYNYC